MQAELFTQRLIQSGLASGHELLGCSEKDIADIQKALGLQLPGEYRDFLKACGRGMGRFMHGIDVLYPRIVSTNQKYRQDLEEYCNLPKDAYLFSQRMGETFFYFLTVGTGDDPPVYRWPESSEYKWSDQERPTPEFSSIWDFFGVVLNDESGC